MRSELCVITCLDAPHFLHLKWRHCYRPYGFLHDCDPSPPSHLRSLHRSLINLTPGDGFPSQPRSEVMGIQSVTNGGASTELAPLGVQVVLHSPCQTPHCSPKVATETWARLFRVQVTDQFFHYPLVTLQFLWWDFFFTVPSYFVNVYTAFPPQTWKVTACFCNFLSALIIFTLTRVLCLWKAHVM